MQLVDHQSNNKLSKLTDVSAHNKSSNNRNLSERDLNNSLVQNDQIESKQQHVFISLSDLMDFRTRQCKDYQRGICKDSMKCWNSHSETWPRRSPLVYNYDYKLCSNINFVKSLDKMQLQGKCKYGRKCRYSHSKEEQLYHPLLYKTRMCMNYPNCKSYYCPFAHGMGEVRNTKQMLPNTKNDNSNPVNLNINDSDCNLKVSFQALTPSTVSAITTPPISPKRLSKSILDNLDFNDNDKSLEDDCLDFAFESLALNKEVLHVESKYDYDNMGNFTIKNENFHSNWVSTTSASHDDESHFNDTIKNGREMYTTWGPYSDNYFHNYDVTIHDEPDLVNDQIGYDVVDDQWLSGVMQTGLDMATAEANRFLTTRMVFLPERSDFDDFYEPNYNKTPFSRFDNFFSDNIPIQSKIGNEKKDVVCKNASSQTVDFPPGFFYN